MGEISTLEEAKRIIPMKFDLISTTLSGYTRESQEVKAVNLDLIRQIHAITDIPIIAEGKIRCEPRGGGSPESGSARSCGRNFHYQAGNYYGALCGRYPGGGKLNR